MEKEQAYFLILGMIINDGYDGTLTVGKSIGYAGILVVIVLLMMTGGVAGAYFGSKASVNFAADLRRDVYTKIQKYSFSNIDKFSASSLVTRMTNDVTQLQNFVNMLLRMALRSPGMFIGGIIMAVSLRPSLSVVLAVLSALTFSTYTILTKKFMTKLSGVIQSGISFVIGSIILTIVLMCCKIDVFGGISSSNIWNMLYISIIVTGLGYWAYFGAIKNGGPQTAALSFLIKPILTPFAAFLILTEGFKSNVFVAVVFVVIGAALASGTLQNLIKKK